MASPGVQKAIDEFEELSDFDLSRYLIKVERFFTINHPKIINWYKGVTDVPDSESFKNLFIMLHESTKCLSKFVEIKNRFNLKFYHFELLEKIEIVNTQLVKCLWLSKLLRSTRSANSYKSKLEVDYVMKRYETLESVQKDQIQFANFDNDWWTLAIKNDLSESDYDNKGGQNLKLPLNFKAGQFLTSVVDNPVGEKLYGRDIKRKLTFADDDLETLNYNDTVLQSLDVFLETRLSTVPEFPKLGYNESLVTGSTKGTASISVLRRQLLNIFNTDDSFDDFKITKLEFDKDALIFDFEINTVRGVSISKTIKF
jgi:hypothetical protein